MSAPLRIALPKGRMWNWSVGLLADAGVRIAPDDESSRKLVLPSACGAYELLPVKNMDVPVYVEAGVADAGVVGYDVVQERRSDVLIPVDLRFGECRLSVAAPEDVPYPRLRSDATPRVATKYVRIARRFFGQKGIHVDVIRISGSVELAPLLGLSDWIVDLVETGRTLRENGLTERDHVLDTSVRWIVNRASHKLRLEEHTALARALENRIGKAEVA